MAVISPLLILNFTPDSFSDGSLYQQQTDLLWQSTLDYLNAGGRSFDIGAESTAPMNASISSKVEQERLISYFLPWWERLTTYLTQQKISYHHELVLSFDTYQWETLNFLASLPQLHGVKKIWNDVSGIVDERVGDWLQEHGEWSYVACHSQVPTRELSGQHKKYIAPDIDIVAAVKFFFQEVLACWEEWSLPAERLILDPCFGFSKNSQQNKLLMDAFPQELVGLHQQWLLGISRKSFLQQSYQEIKNSSVAPWPLLQLDAPQKTEMLHALWMSKMVNIGESRETKVSWRLHDASLYWQWRTVFA